MKNKSFLLFLLGIIPFLTEAQLKINEIMPNNVSFKMDESYNYSMWVEVYNPTRYTLNLSNYYFTDDKTSPAKWKPISKPLSPDSYDILWCERPERTGHA